MLKEPPEFFYTEPCVADDSTHSECIDWVVPRNGQDTSSVRHDDMSSLPENPKACLFQGSYGSQMIHSGQLGHDLPDPMR